MSKRSLACDQDGEPFLRVGDPNDEDIVPPTYRAAHFYSILHSKLFTFLIGDEESPIVVHSGAIAALSLPLERLINGPMKEAQENVARLAELEIAEFERVCEFAYRGDYAEPKTIRFSDTEIDVAEDHRIASESIVRREADYRYAWLISEFLSASYGNNKLAFDHGKPPLWHSSLQPLDRSANGWEETPGAEDDPCSVVTWKDDISEVLFGHARLYVFADKYRITSLSDLALHKLHKFLTSLRVFPLTRDPIMALVDYAYSSENIPDRDTEEQLDPLRTVLIRFILLHRTAFSAYRGHINALKDMNEYAMDYVSVMERMLGVDEYPMPKEEVYHEN
ncbi:hypothetical protein FB567DRAFT_132339 [Paraphoma chrysanthemicola]|uniref:BTB domain-containing protein n=1 Tax=Paraphoma chrysanthemicola TaxID=798071 RepID=A0A8K0QY52_9PLEO|nr:hypothetical protein FB567DRAFT_132339 [Paraphoma chrysanthemicola]